MMNREGDRLFLKQLPNWVDSDVEAIQIYEDEDMIFLSLLPK